jgi:hypothetical protein
MKLHGPKKAFASLRSRSFGELKRKRFVTMTRPPSTRDVDQRKL